MLTPAYLTLSSRRCKRQLIQRACKLKSPILALPLDIATLRHRLRRSATDEFTATRLTRGKEPVIPGKALAGEVQIGAVGWHLLVFVVRPSRNDARAVGWRATAKLARDRRAAAVGADDESRPQRPIPVLRFHLHARTVVSCFGADRRDVFENGCPCSMSQSSSIRLFLRLRKFEYQHRSATW